MQQVVLNEGEEQFAALVAKAEAGESLTILREGRPVAQIVPFPVSEEESLFQRASEEDRARAVAELQAIMDRGLDLGIVWNGRDELYDRD